MTAPSITRDEVVILLRGVRQPDAGTPPDAIVVAWLDRLQGYSLGECEAAVLAMGPQARTATPSVIAGSIDNARARSQPADHTPAAARSSATVVSLPQWQRETQRARHRDAGWRGIQRVYAAMGWDRNAEADHARGVPCPFCHAKPGVLCSPLSRDRAGTHEPRDRTTFLHPSRLAAANHPENAR
jgi:hypothetical protein